MNTNLTARETKRGAAIFTILVIIVTASAFLATMTSASINRALTARRLAERVQAIHIAEAGVHYAYSVMATNFNVRTNPAAFPPTSYAGGVFDVTIVCVSSNMASICSTGTFGRVTEEVALDVRAEQSPGRTYDLTGFEYAMLAGQDLSFSGCGSITSTNGPTRIHSNGEMTVRGSASPNIGMQSSTEIRINNNVTIDGDVTAPDLTYNPSKVTITGTASEDTVPLVEFPDIDLTPYYNWADQHSEVHSGFSMSGGTYTPAGGILWVQGDVQLSGSAQVNGSIIATGDIHVSGSANVYATTCAFALASRDGTEIRNQSTGTIQGLIYAKLGDYKHTANGTMIGQVVVRGDIDKAGVSDTFVYEQYIPVPPQDDEGSTLVLAVTAWQK
jgi:cytoskeletal protein CcmA (bactofilin family)